MSAISIAIIGISAAFGAGFGLLAIIVALYFYGPSSCRKNRGQLSVQNNYFHLNPLAHFLNKDRQEAHMPMLPLNNNN
jgi:hypothetical protein